MGVGLDGHLYGPSDIPHRAPPVSGPEDGQAVAVRNHKLPRKKVAMNLSPHFTEEELTASSTGQRLGINNAPSDEIRDNLATLADGLERVRAMLGCAMHIDSGYRCPKLNAAVKGAKNSAHLNGLAADFVAPGFGTPQEIVARLVASSAVIGFNRIIQEGTWVHIDFPEEGTPPAYIVLTAHFSASGTTYTRGA